MDNVSLKIWQVMQPMVRKEITKQIQACMKCKVMTVTTAYNSQTQTVGVREPFSNEVFLPVYGGVDATKLVKGAVAWVVAMHGSWSNAMVFMLGDGSGTTGLSVDDKTEIEQAATQAVLQALPEWVRSEEKPTYTAQEVGAVPITGGRMTGSLNLGATDSQNSVLLTQHRLGTDGQTKWQLQLLIDNGNTGNVAFFQNGQLANRIRFFTDKTTLGQPLDIGSGGFGGTTAAEARANLGITPQNIEAVPLAGGTMTGALTLGKTSSATAVPLTINRQGTTGQALSMQNTISNGDEANVSFYDNGTMTNRLILGSSRSSFKVPLDIAGGGHGGTTAAQARENLGITMAFFANMMYPVGSLYISTAATSPATLFGIGTWEQIKDVFLLAAGSTYTAGSTGGEAEHTHLYGLQYGSWYQILSIEHNENAGVLTYDKNGGVTTGEEIELGGIVASINSIAEGSNSLVEKSMGHYQNVGNVSYESTMPPYLAVYVWKRTA